MKVEFINGVIVLYDRMIISKKDANDLIAQLRAVTERAWPEPVPCYGEPIRCDTCNGIGEDCSTCNETGENWRYEGGIVAGWYAGPLIEKETTE
jgi:hypothetical protein